MPVNTSATGKSTRAGRRAVLFELEYAACQGRSVMFDVVKSACESREIKVTPVMFSRYFIDRTFKDAVEQFLGFIGKGRFSEEKLVAEIIEGYDAALAKGRKVHPVIARMLNVADEKRMAKGAVTFLPKETADKIMADGGCAPGPDVAVMTIPGANRDTYRENVWLRLAKNLGVAPNRCTVLATSSGGCKAAVSAGAHCIAMPDEYTAFQDFTGADFVVERLNDSAVDAFMSASGL